MKKTEYGRKASEAGEKVLHATREAAKNVQQSAEALGDAPGIKQVASVSCLFGILEILNLCNFFYSEHE